MSQHGDGLFNTKIPILHRCFASSPSKPHASIFSTDTVRLSKVLSLHTENLVISRREAERMIRSGDVTLAGNVLTSPMMMLKEEDLNDGALKVNGKVVNLRSSKGPRSVAGEENSVHKTRVWIAHKLPGEIVADNDPYDRPSLLQRLIRGGVGKVGKTRLHLKSVGRLDMNTEGLILVTNDGKYAREMELPSNKLHRTYRVRVHGLLTDHKLARIRKGVTVEGIRYPPMRIIPESTRQSQSTNKWLKVTCTEGKNRQIRNVFKYLGLTVTRLIRISYGDYRLQTIPPGMAIEVPAKHIENQKHRGRLIRPTKPAPKRSDEAESSKAVQWVRH
ncbi:predicted protein [Phaeodactylum tricornutum CCAP 1055/1]|jgi:23S rRNA pseudouridine2605 synthase|uniref:Pseudouridine synthase RsuA/RluA-like domain-containing protein n=2 Tax=Phaeodactylum tricornutum TaxID=2850 RepID=B7G1P9_PHATC|nr:predicted protein [Phaeodactylum tricornutum CCAP 1055/1]EEC47722.1 predicted protein [Phaeodactylum tricornutum CCAP 1055/1]|eukprot:XP_002181070.1 predicted protein [Phaeodactylum tricornutum CCAP 1055/1]